MTALDAVRAEARAAGLVGGRETRSGAADAAVTGGGARSRSEGWTLTGHAAVFDVEAVIANLFRESIAPGAFRGVLGDDVRHLIDHQPTLVMGRTKSGTLRIREDAVGLAFEVTLNREDPEAVGLRARVRRGDVSQSSFAFVADKEAWTEGRDGLPLRRITRMRRLYDTSTVTYPAYEGAESGVRGGDGFAAAAMARRHARRGRLL